MKSLRLLVTGFALSAASALPAKLVEPHNDANNDKGDAAFARKDWATAVACYTAALKNVHYVTTYINRATAYIGLGRYDEAIADYDKAILMSNDEVGSDRRLRYIIYNRALAYMGAKQYEKSIGDFNYIIPKIDRAFGPFKDRGYCQLQLGRLKEARHDTEVALKVSPNHVEANLQLLSILRKEGDIPAFHQQLAKLTALADKSPDVGLYDQVAWLLASSTSDEIRDGPRAVLYATRACELSSWADPDSIDTLAVACASVGDFPNAIKWEQACLNRRNLDEAKRHAVEVRLEGFQHSVPYRETD